MASRRRSWFIAFIATALGFLLFAYDDLLDETKADHSSTLHTLAEMVEFILQGPGMGVLAFVVCEYLRLADEALRRERAQALQQRFLVLGRIAAGVAHEVRNPLHNIRLLLDEMHHTGGLPADQPLCQRVESNLERINRAVELIYQLAKPSGLANQVDVGVDLVVLVNEAVAVEHGRSGVVVERDVPMTTAPVACAPSTIRIVLDNLLRNAAVAGGTVQMLVRPGNDVWEAVIRNRGTLPEDLVGDGSEEPVESIKEGGLGLGLFISRQLLRNAGGSLVLRQHGDQVEAVVRLPRWSDFVL
ncbi:MAG TPA: HAMP domain-containing sensor histidine kinase [Planctomycetota bacterium]|nr:HAMP domain-containing sensor histidine kinase [Planctomycetota bacterium]